MKRIIYKTKRSSMTGNVCLRTLGEVIPRPGADEFENET